MFDFILDIRLMLIANVSAECKTLECVRNTGRHVTASTSGVDG